jgi:hypothetical protein
MFLKNRELRIKLSKANKADETTAPRTMDEILNPDAVKLINEHMTKFARNLAITVGVVIVGIKVADTLSEIAVKKTKSADNE